MDVTGHYLTEPIICYWVLKIMKPGGGYRLDYLIDMVEHAHHSIGGRKSTATRGQMVDRFLRALDDLRKHELVEYEEGEHSWSVWRTSVDRDSLLTFLEAKAAKEAPAEIIIGDGEQSVYGWYLPTYRILAKIRGEEHWPVKVGTTAKIAPHKRVITHIGTAPEQPVLGFVLKTDRAELMEKWLHIELTLRKRHIPDALGKEWFLTNPEELRRIVTTKMANLAREGSEEEDNE